MQEMGEVTEAAGRLAKKWRNQWKHQGSTNACNTNMELTKGHEQQPRSTNRWTKQNWKTIHLGWLAQHQMLTSTRTDLETTLGPQRIKQALDIGNYQEIVEHGWDMWEQQNKALHQSALNRDTILEKDINNQIRQMYALGPGQLTWADISLLKNPILEHQLSLPMTTKQQWLESIVAAIHRKKLHKYGATVAEQWLMEAWVIWNPEQPAPVPTSHQCRPTQQARQHGIFNYYIIYINSEESG